MTRKKNARPADGAAEQAAEQVQASRQGHTSDLDFIMGNAERQVFKTVVADFLGTGEQSGRTMKQLQEILDEDSRSIRARVERERCDTPILSGQTGYFLPSCEDEVKRFCGSMRRRARAIWTSAANVEKAAGLSRRDQEQIDGQEVLF